MNLACGTTPVLEKKAPRILGQMKIFHVGSHQFRESLRELLREFWFSYCSSREMPFREWNFVFREWNFEFRELVREYPGTLPELREWTYHSESVFPEIGVVPRLLNERPTNPKNRVPRSMECERFRDRIPPQFFLVLFPHPMPVKMRPVRSVGVGPLQAKTQKMQKIRIFLLRVLSATLILSKNSRVLVGKSQLKSGSLSYLS